jgi:ribosomal protection tetracycline resistance protein
MSSLTPPQQPRLNLGIVAHVDAGKTTLTERLLYETGVSTHLGRVDHGDTVTDADDIERRRGITIRSAVVTFTVGDLKVNLIDTPGHADFVAEVERALAVLDGAVLVVSAVERVQAQTRALIRTMERLGIPFLVFANKIDRVGASYDATLTEVRDALAGDAIALNRPVSIGMHEATVENRHGPELVEELADRLSVFDDGVLRSYVDGSPPVERDLLRCLAGATAAGRMHPVVFGAALTGTGVTDVLAALATYLPPAAGASDQPLHASVFKIEPDAAGRPLAYVRMRAGLLASRDELVRHHRDRGGEVIAVPGRVQRVATYVAGSATCEVPALAGDIAVVSGLADAEIGDQLGRWDPAYGLRLFPAPGLESVVVARDPADRSRLYEAVRVLSAQDPLIDARLDGVDEELTVSLYGEVQREVLASRLAEEFGIEVDISEARTVLVERVVATGEWSARVRTRNASVAFRVEPGPAESGGEYRMGTERGYLIPSFHRAIEETVPRVMATGPLGWRVVDWVVTLTDARFSAPTPPAGYFRELTELALGRAVGLAGTRACEPISAFEVEVPEESYAAVLRVRRRRRQAGPARLRRRPLHGHRKHPDRVGARPGARAPRADGRARVPGQRAERLLARRLAPDGPGARVAGEDGPHQRGHRPDDDENVQHGHPGATTVVQQGGRDRHDRKAGRDPAQVLGVGLVLLDVVEHRPRRVREAGVGRVEVVARVVRGPHRPDRDHRQDQRRPPQHVAIFRQHDVADRRQARERQEDHRCVDDERMEWEAGDLPLHRRNEGRARGHGHASSYGRSSGRVRSPHGGSP